MMKWAFFLIFTSVVLFSCDNVSLKVKLPQPLKELNILEYDKALFEQKHQLIKEQLDSLAQIYPVFISGNYQSTSALLNLMDYIENPLNRKLYREAKAQQVAFDQVKKSLSLAYNYHLYYFPKDSFPDIYFYISGLNYEEPIILVNQKAILVGKDLFLGASYKVYDQYQIPKFISYNFEHHFLPFQLFRKYAFKRFSPSLKGENLLEYMIAMGKVEYYIHALFPDTDEQSRFAFTNEQMAWCKQKERAFWKHLAEEQMLFNTDYYAFKKYVEDRPFVSSLERESPGRAGVWIGYQIVKKYMEKTGSSLIDLMQETDNLKIFNASKYTP